MTDLEVFWYQLDDARSRGDNEGCLLALRRFVRARSKRPKPRPVMETFNWPREHFMQLRDWHLHMVEEYGFRPEYNRDELRKYFLTNYHRLFGPLRKSKAMEVPSDQLRKGLMIARLLDLIEMRRAETPRREHHTNTSFAFAQKYGDADAPARSLTRLLVGEFSNETQMNDQILEEAERLFKQSKPVPTISEYAREQQAIRSNFERLKAQRRAREEAVSRNDPELPARGACARDPR